MKLIIGLGCSWTQGEGGYTEEIWKKYNGRVNLPMHKSRHLIPMEWKNSWVNVLCQDHFIDYTPINLGQRGMGNRGAARSLYLTNIDFSKVEDAIVIYMLSGQERFDFFRQDFEIKQQKEHPYKVANHYNFQTVWPNDSTKLWKIYSKEVWSESASAAETYCNIMEVQTFCKAHGFKLVIANSFDSDIRLQIKTHCKELENQINWSNYLHNAVNYENFLYYLIDKDNWLTGENKRHYYQKYHSLKWPKKYLTNCIHPTIDGYKEIADELSKFIKDNY